MSPLVRAGMDRSASLGGALKVLAVLMFLEMLVPQQLQEDVLFDATRICACAYVRIAGLPNHWGRCP